MRRICRESEDLNQERKVYIFESRERDGYFRDCVFSKMILDFHNEEIIDTLFFDSDSRYPILEDYCNSNPRFPIEIQTHERNNVTDYFLDVYQYSRKKPSKIHLACLLGNLEEYPGEDSVAKFYGLFDNANFDVEFIIR